MAKMNAAVFGWQRGWQLLQMVWEDWEVDGKSAVASTIAPVGCLSSMLPCKLPLPLPLFLPSNFQ